MTTKSRLLGLAFAAADTLLEVDGDGRVALVLGSCPSPGGTPAASWQGRMLVDLVDKASRKPLSDALQAIQPSLRSAPIEALVSCDAERVRRASIRMFQLPELAPAISCAVTYVGATFTLALPCPPALLSADGFLSRVHDVLQDSSSPNGMAVSFVEVLGLDRPGEANQRAASRIEAALQTASVGGTSAARLSPERFAVVCDADAASDLTEEVHTAALAEGVDLVAMVSRIALAPDGPAEPTVRALRFALEACLKDGVGQAGVTFSESLKRTLQEADKFRAIVRERSFTLEYQPIADLGSGAAHHFEALARFGGHGTPESIHLAESLGLIESFDLAVVEKALQMLQRPRFTTTRVAVNVSGASIGADGYVEGLLRMTAGAPAIRSRLLVELTETAAIGDLDAATRRLTALRNNGIRVCLDDFGVGAASLDYLHSLPADIVKIDGRFVRDITTDQRSRALVSHVVKLCRELKMTTVVEMVETEEQAAIVRGLGVNFGQGWLFGHPTAEPLVPTVHPVSARRLGAVAGWNLSGKIPGGDK